MSERKAVYNVRIPNEFTSLQDYTTTLAGILACHPQGEDLYRLFVAVYEKTRADCRDKAIIDAGNFQWIRAGSEVER